MKRYFEVSAIGHNEFDIRFDRDGVYVAYASLILADTKADAEAKLRKDGRFRRVMRQNDEDWRTVPVIVERVSVRDFSSGLHKEPRKSYRRARFLKRVSA